MESTATLPLPHKTASVEKVEPHGQPFRFPVKAEVGRVFQSLLDVETFLNQESLQQNRHVRYTFTQNTKRGTLTIQCCQCTSFMLLLQLPSKNWLLKDVRPDHLAAARLPKISQYEQTLQYFDDLRKQGISIDTRANLKEELVKKFDISTQEFDELKQIYLDRQQNSFEKLQDHVEKQGYQIQGSPILPNRSHPQAILIVSKAMKDNYSKYGQCLYFKTIKTQIWDTMKFGCAYRMGLFYVRDCSARILLAGGVFFQGTKVKHLLQTFELFFQHQNPQVTQSLVTSHNKQLVEMVTQLLRSPKLANIQHLYDPYTSAVHIQKQQTKNPDHAIKYLRIAVETYKKDIYEKAILKLQAKPQTKSLMQFLQNTDKLCFCAISPAFIGLWQFFESQPNIHKLATRFRKKGNTIAQKTDTLIKLDTMLLKEQELGKMEHQIFVDYADERVTLLARQLEPLAMQIFLKNYLKSREWSAFPTPDGFELVNIENECHMVHELKCDCDFTAKTGIPCEHVINCATVLPDVDYRALFWTRWLRPSPSKWLVDLTDSLVI